VIVPRPWLSLIVALTAPLRSTVKVSSASCFVSPYTVTSTVLDVSPGRKLSVPEVAAKSPSATVAVPSAVAKSTLVVNAVVPVFVTANENVELPTLPSAALTSPIEKDAELSSSMMVCVALGVSITMPVAGCGFEMLTVKVSFVSAVASISTGDPVRWMRTVGEKYLPDIW